MPLYAQKQDIGPTLATMEIPSEATVGWKIGYRAKARSKTSFKRKRVKAMFSNKV